MAYYTGTLPSIIWNYGDIMYLHTSIGEEFGGFIIHLPNGNDEEFGGFIMHLLHNGNDEDFDPVAALERLKEYDRKWQAEQDLRAPARRQRLREYIRRDLEEHYAPPVIPPIQEPVPPVPPEVQYRKAIFSLHWTAEYYAKRMTPVNEVVPEVVVPEVVVPEVVVPIWNETLLHEARVILVNWNNEIYAIVERYERLDTNQLDKMILSLINQSPSKPYWILEHESQQNALNQRVTYILGILQKNLSEANPEFPILLYEVQASIAASVNVINIANIKNDPSMISTDNPDFIALKEYFISVYENKLKSRL